MIMKVFFVWQKTNQLHMLVVKALRPQDVLTHQMARHAIATLIIAILKALLKLMVEVAVLMETVRALPLDHLKYHGSFQWLFLECGMYSTCIEA